MEYFEVRAETHKEMHISRQVEGIGGYTTKILLVSALME